MAEYEMQEMNLPNKDGKRILYPRLVQSGQASTDYIAKILSEKSSLPEVTSKVCYRNWPMNWLTKWDKGNR